MPDRLNNIAAMSLALGLLATPMPAFASSTSEHKPAHWHPLAAALVIRHALVFVDTVTRKARVIPTGKLIPEEADLSPDRRLIVFDAGDPTGDGVPRLYLLTLKTGRFQRLRVGLPGDQRFPRFADGGRQVYFAATVGRGPGGEGNPHQIYRLDLKTRHVTHVPVAKHSCGFEAVAQKHGKVSFLASSCFRGWALKTKGPGRHRARRLSRARGLTAEVAVDPDGDRLLYTKRTGAGLELNVEGTNGKHHTVKLIHAPGARIQPRWVCNRHVVFFRSGGIWYLNVDTGRLTKIVDVSEIQGLSHSPAPATEPAASRQGSK